MRKVSWWQPVLFAAAAGGMAWGIRGQYGHESGAMIAGLLVSLVLVLLLAPGVSALTAARIVALATIAMGFGGTETYGQTIGLTQNPDVVGNWSSLLWGMLGLAIKGGTWIGFCGVFLGMGLGGKRYDMLRMLLIMVGALAAYRVGISLLNSPFDPELHQVPAIYFSKAMDPKPRYEAWGGLLFALIFVIACCAFRFRDGLAWRLGLWGLLGGALGFPGGQCLQAFHSWNPEFFQRGIWVILDSHMNWWNMMETTFGTVMGATLGLGAWIHRRRIQPAEHVPQFQRIREWEWALLALHCTLLVGSEFALSAPISEFYDLGLIMGVIPMVAIAGGRWWPYLVVFPVTLLPIAGKTILILVYENKAIEPGFGWLLYGVFPMLVGVWAIYRFWRSEAGKSGYWFACHALALCAWMYFVLNFAVFRYPWFWEPWTARVPNALIFAVDLLLLTWLAASAYESRKQASGGV